MSKLSEAEGAEKKSMLKSVKARSPRGCFTLLVLNLAVLIYAVLFTVKGYEALPFGIEAARLSGVLPAVALKVSEDRLKALKAGDFSAMPGSNALTAEESVWILKVKHSGTYEVHARTTAPVYPLIALKDEAGQVLSRNIKPMKQAHRAQDDKERAGSYARATLPVKLEAEKEYRVAVSLANSGAGRGFYRLWIEMPGQGAGAGIFALFFLFLILSYFFAVLIPFVLNPLFQMGFSKKRDGFKA